MKDELCRKKNDKNSCIVTKSYLTEDNDENKKSSRYRKVYHKTKK